MPGNQSNFHILFGEPLIHKQIPTRRWTIGAVRDKAITEMRSHLGDSFPDIMMPLANNVKIFREQSGTGQPTTLIRNLRPSENGDYLALIPPPTNLSEFGALLTKLKNDIEQSKIKHEHDIEQSKIKHEHDIEQSKIKHERDIEQLKNDIEVSRRKHEEHEWALADLRAQQADTLSWIVVGDDGVLDRIMLRNLLDKAQTVVADACGLRTNDQESPSWNWRVQFIGMKLEDRLVKATSLLRNSSLDDAIVHQLCTSQHALSILVEGSKIRKEGDRLAHEEIINIQRYTFAIERQSNSDLEKSRALKLLLEIVKG